MDRGAWQATVHGVTRFGHNLATETTTVTEIPSHTVLLLQSVNSVAQSCPTLQDPMDCSIPGFLVHHQLPSNSCPLSQWRHLILCHPLLLQSSIFPSIRVFSNESVLCIRWPKNWSFSFSISPSNEYSGLISSRIDWLDLLAVQGTLESSPTPQFKHQFFNTQLSL